MSNAILINGPKLWSSTLGFSQVGQFFENTFSCFDTILIPRDLPVYEFLKLRRYLVRNYENSKTKIKLTPDVLLALKNWKKSRKFSKFKKKINESIVVKNLTIDIPIINSDHNSDKCRVIDYRGDVPNVTPNNRICDYDFEGYGGDFSRPSFCYGQRTMWNYQEEDMSDCDIDINNFPDQFNNSFETMNDDGYLSNDDVDMINNIPDTFNEFNEFNDMNYLLNLSDLKFKPNPKPFPEFVVRSRQIFIYPNHTQRKIINSWFNATTAMYNHVVKYIKSWKPLKKFLKLRDLYSEINNLEIQKKDLAKRTKKTKIKKDKLFEIIKADDSMAKKENKKLMKNKKSIKRIKFTLKAISAYNKRIKEYSLLRREQTAQNVERQNIEPKLEKDKREYNKLKKWVDKALSFETLRSNVFYNIRDKIIARNVWKPAVKKVKNAKLKGGKLKRYVKSKKCVKLKKEVKPKKLVKPVEPKKSNRRTPVKQHKNSIPVHIMDQAINAACIVFDTARTKIFKRQIDRFRVRYWRNDKKTKVMEIENTYIKNGQIARINKMKMKAQIRGHNKLQDYKLTTTNGIKLHYDTKLKRYSLLVPEYYQPEESKALPGTKVGADPGSRKFQTLTSDTEVVKIGSNMSGKISKRLCRIDKINNDKKLNENTKRLREANQYRKINNMVDDMHW